MNNSAGVNSHIRRNFGSYEILWTIENFRLLMCKKEWEINSPEFSVRGLQSTSWKLILKSTTRENNSNDDCYLLVFLKRLESDTGPDVVRANWKLSLLNCKRKDNFFTEIEHLFKKNSSYCEIIENTECLLTDFKPFEIDNLMIQCQLIVKCEIDYIPFFKCTDIGKGSLSDDLCILSRYKRASDVVLRIKHHTIPAYKAILRARNATLATIIDQDPTTQVIDLLSPDLREPNPNPGTESKEPRFYTSSCINIDGVERVVNYLYSGKFEEVIEKPSVSLYEFATLLDVKEVLAFYFPDELSLNSAVVADENVFFWFIPNFELRHDDMILSPPLTKGQMKSVWRLKLFPKGVDNTGEFVSLYAEVFGERIAQDVCLEFAIIGADETFHAFRRVQKSLGLGEILGFQDFIKRDSLENNSTLNGGILRIIFKLRTSNGYICLSSEDASITSVVSPPEGYSFDLLSEQIGNMFHDDDFKDFTIHCDGGSFKVHSFIMMARSDNFSQVLKAHDAKNNEIRIPFFKSDILRIVLFYIYSGTFKERDVKVIDKIYSVATYFGIEALANTCSRILTDSFRKSFYQNQFSSSQE